VDSQVLLTAVGENVFLPLPVCPDSQPSWTCSCILQLLLPLSHVLLWLWPSSPGLSRAWQWHWMQLTQCNLLSQDPLLDHIFHTRGRLCGFWELECGHCSAHHSLISCWFSWSLSPTKDRDQRRLLLESVGVSHLRHNGHEEIFHILTFFHAFQQKARDFAIRLQSQCSRFSTSERWSPLPP
jgi:hypothetical protein